MSQDATASVLQQLRQRASNYVQRLQTVGKDDFKLVTMCHVAVSIVTGALSAGTIHSSCVQY